MPPAPEVRASEPTVIWAEPRMPPSVVRCRAGTLPLSRVIAWLMLTESAAVLVAWISRPPAVMSPSSAFVNPSRPDASAAPRSIFVPAVIVYNSTGLGPPAVIAVPEVARSMLS